MKEEIKFLHTYIKQFRQKSNEFYIYLEQYLRNGIIEIMNINPGMTETS